MNNKDAEVNPQNESMALIKSAIDNPDCQPEKLREMLVFMKDLEAHGARKEFNSAMHKAQSAMPIVVKDALNKGTDSRYAKIDTVAKAIKPIYNQHGFSVSFSEEPCERQDWLLIVMIVRHIGNHVETYKRFAPIDDKGPKGGDVKTKLHGCQSTMTYIQRHLLLATFGVTVSDTDDDGNGGQGEDLITEAQADEIEKYLGNLDDEIRQGVLDLCQIDTIDQIPTDMYKGIVKKLKLSIGKQEGES